VSTFVRWSAKPDEVAGDAADAIAAAYGPPGQVATLILPADVSWSDVAGAPGSLPRAERRSARAVADDTIRDIAQALKSGAPAALLVGGRACRRGELERARAIADATGAKLLCETFPARIERGAGIASVDRIAYLAEFAAMQLDGLEHLVLVDAKSPVSFFAYPGKASDLVPQGCTVHTLAGPADDVTGALAALGDRLSADPRTAAVAQPARPDAPTGPLDAGTLCAVLGALLPEGAIVSDEGNTSGLFAPGATAGAPPHDWLCLTGGAIGQGLPVALGAAVACPDRRVIALESDGSALYTMQSWWTMAREGLDVTTIICNNGAYAVLNMELGRVGAEAAAGPVARSMFELHRPDLDFVALAKGMGLPASRATTADELHDQLARSLATEGACVIEAMVPPIA
jgi:acetolactate synthase-1/2/3 large subunit